MFLEEGLGGKNYKRRTRFSAMINQQPLALLTVYLHPMLESTRVLFRTTPGYVISPWEGICMCLCVCVLRWRACTHCAYALRVRVRGRGRGRVHTAVWIDDHTVNSMSVFFLRRAGGSNSRSFAIVKSIGDNHRDCSRGRHSRSKLQLSCLQRLPQFR